MTAKPPTEDGHHGFVHVTVEDVTEALVPSPEQARAIDLLELNPTGAAAVRLTWLQWEHVDRVVVQLGALGVPVPRQAADDQRSAR